MAFRILEFIVILAFIQWIWSLPLSCLYNGTSHKEGETVRTDEPCLTCVCHRGTLECSVRVCAEYPNVLPPGCFLLHKPNHCCLQIVCGERFSPVGVELRTSFKPENKLPKKDCIINGSIYGEGSAVASSQPCEYCYCIEGDIKCIKPRCSHPFEGCKAVYGTSSCCPTHYDCRESNISFLTSQMENFVSADTNITLSKNSSESHLNLDSIPEKGELNVSRNAEMDFSKAKKEKPTTTKTEKRNAEDTAVAPAPNSTVPVMEEHLITLGEESRIIEFTEDSTLEMTVNKSDSSSVKGGIEESSGVQMQRTSDTYKEIETSMGSQDGSLDNASQEIVDYDSYDYSEPKLPPSLPNLVIFPFVAADAVVKGENIGEPDSYDKDETGKMNTHLVFYKDYFSPPVRSEGGFVPKKPLKSEKPFYAQAHLSKDQIELPNEDMRENAVVASQANVFPQELNEMNFSTSADGKGTNADKFDSFLTVTVGTLLEDIIQPETSAGFVLRADDETSTFRENNQTQKPVTVTFKNFIVDFYPNFMITTSKRVQLETQTTAKEGFIQKKSQNAGIPLDSTSDLSFSFHDEKDASAPSEARREGLVLTPDNSRGNENFFPDKFTHSFLSEAVSTTAMTSTSKKHKFSSKIKNQLFTTEKPKREKISQKVEPEVGTANSSVESRTVLSEDFVTLFSLADQPKNHHEKRKLVKAEEITRFVETVKPSKTKNEKDELSESLSEGNPSSINGKTNLVATTSKDNSVIPNAGALLKLAGCNIYGMMYRVGKIISELSGPCLECLCTDLGVQCKPLQC